MNTAEQLPTHELIHVWDLAKLSHVVRQHHMSGCQRDKDSMMFSLFRSGSMRNAMARLYSSSVYHITSWYDKVRIRSKTIAWRLGITSTGRTYFPSLS